MSTKTKPSPAAATATKDGVTTGLTIEAGALIPDLDTYGAATDREVVYWVGVTDECPVELIDLAGINFPKMNAIPVRDPAGGEFDVLMPQFGALVRLNKGRLKLMQDRLARTVIRFEKVEAIERVDKDTGEITGDPHRRARRGQVITIPTDEDIKDRKASGRVFNTYVRGDNDEPAAKYMYAMPCERQDNPTRGTHIRVLSETGLVWPEEAKED